MKTKITELVFILDKSGSMSGLERDTIDGYNSMIRKQKEVEGEVNITTVLFDDNYQLLHERVNIKNINPMTDKDYFVEGSTALLDAIGKTIHKIGNQQRLAKKENRADKVMFIITTDGMENASHEYTNEKIKFMVERQKEKYGWEFIFLGANIDAISTAAKFGISSDRAANYNSDGEGTRLNYEAVSEVVSEFRTCNEISENWKERIDEDFKQRGKSNRRR